MIRMSYSLLDRWLRGDKTGAIAMYLRTPIKKTQAMEEGIAFDKKVKGLLVKNLVVPELGGQKFPPDTVVDLTLMNSYPGFDIKGELDAYSKMEATIIEFKCSKIYDSGDYADSYQLPTYFLLARKNNLPVEKGIVIRYDPVRKMFDTSILYCSQKRIDTVENIYRKVAPEIEAYFKEEGVL